MKTLTKEEFETIGKQLEEYNKKAPKREKRPGKTYDSDIMLIVWANDIMEWAGKREYYDLVKWAGATIKKRKERFKQRRIAPNAGSLGIRTAD